MRQSAIGVVWWLLSWWSAGGTLWLVFLGVELLLLRGGVRRVPRLGELPLPAAGARHPALTVVVAARNEEQTVAAALESILGSAYPQLRVLAVDDRSTDRTGAILDGLAAGDPRLRVLHVHDLPRGWLGKNHALQRGAAEAGGEWLLFTDADVRFAPEAIRRAVLHCEREGLDHLAAVPALLAEGVWLRLFLGWYALILTLWQRPWQASHPRRRASVGVGAFNLVRRRAYLGVGGHAALPLAVADDVVLGRLLKSAGYRQGMVLAGGGPPRRAAPQLELRWYPDLRSAVVGLEKNAFAMFDYRPGLVVGSTVVATLLTFGPFVGAALAPGWHRLPWLAIASLSCAALAAAGAEMMDNFPWVLCILYPLVQVLLTWTVLRSAWCTLARGGVRWRGTFYPLRELRAARPAGARARLR